MLRALVLVLVVANLAFFAWTQGWVDRVVGVSARGDREPERLARQVHPERVTIVPPGAASAASAAEEAAVAAAPPAASAPASPAPNDGVAAAALPPASNSAAAVADAASSASALACLEAGSFLERDLAGVEATLAAVVPRGRWTRLQVDRPGIWIVYMGRYTDRDALQKKEAELRRFKDVEYEEIKTPASLAPGLSIGRFESRAAAADALAALTERGIRTARVVSIRQPALVNVLQIDHVDAALAASLASVKLGPAGRSFVPCQKR